ncbi:CBS domain-containing protein [Paenibacillus sp. NEAU-GSW1]|uniref:CBS domain-containing protein n=1 Tax=Paenibacillus sp. NEAU-GSW1 TaxID=2682486 RepID=UPI0012E2BB57|nr:CBS domain-containing protein [Paenibacillus sp. NEAU-GSW1]MUT66879.1 hypothetical protein [Paenibacillus sp. NEAU-GSW1]
MFDRAKAEPIDQMEDQTDRVNRFEIAFNRIHQKLRELLPDYRNDAFTSMLEEACSRYAMLRVFRQDLRQYARLRNAMVHEYTREDFYIAVPHPEIVDSIESICRIIEKPKSVMSIAVKPIITFQTDTLIQDVFKAIERHGFTSFPVYREKAFQALITEDGLSRWIAGRLKSGPLVDFTHSALEEVLPFEAAHNVVFVSKKMNIFEVDDLYKQKQKEGVKIDAVIVTEKGGMHEKPEGIITSWDLVKID